MVEFRSRFDYFKLGEGMGAHAIRGPQWQVNCWRPCQEARSTTDRPTRDPPGRGSPELDLQYKFLEGGWGHSRPGPLIADGNETELAANLTFKG